MDESTLHFFLRYQNYTTLSGALVTELNINDAIMSFDENDLLHLIMYGNKNFDNNMNISILRNLLKTLEVLVTSFLTIIKNILIPSSISFLNCFFKKFIVLQLGFLL